MNCKKFVASTVAITITFGGAVQADDRMGSDQKMGTSARMASTHGHEINTADNMRDRDMSSILPEDQSNKSELINRTASIRKEVTDSDQLSVAAQNVKIITVDNGTVVLRGPVMSATEKMQIERIARKHSGGAEVKSYLEVKSS